MVTNSTEASHYIGRHATGLGYLVWKASEQVQRAFENLGPTVEQLQRLSAACYIARQALEENIGPGTMSFGATYQRIHHSADNSPKSMEHRITVRIWVDAEAVANLEAYMATRAQVDHAIPGVLSSIVIKGVPVEHLEFRIEGGWRGPVPHSGWAIGNITEQLEGYWQDPGPPF